MITAMLSTATVAIAAWAVVVNRRASSVSPSKELVDTALGLVRELRAGKQEAERARDECHEREQARE